MGEREGRKKEKEKEKRVRTFELRKKLGTEGPSYRPTDGQTDTTSYREATAHLKRKKKKRRSRSEHAVRLEIIRRQPFKLHKIIRTCLITW